MWLRRPIRFIYTTKKVPFTSLFVTTKGDALNMECNPQTLEWECPTLYTIIYKRTKAIASLYDTFEPVPILQRTASRVARIREKIGGYYNAPYW